VHLLQPASLPRLRDISVDGPVLLFTLVVSVACGSDHTCAALKNGRVMCWGSNAAGQLGIGTTSDVQGSVQVTGITNAGLVKANEYASCVLTLDGTASCWGNYYADGAETFLATRAPMALTTSSGQLKNIKLLELGMNDGCAVATSGTLGRHGGEYSMRRLVSTGHALIVPVSLTLWNGFSFQVAAYGASSVCPWGSGSVAGNPSMLYPEPQGQCFDLGTKIAQLLGEETTCVRPQRRPRRLLGNQQCRSGGAEHRLHRRPSRRSSPC
jgi:hypothetical protein